MGILLLVYLFFAMLRFNYIVLKCLGTYMQKKLEKIGLLLFSRFLHPKGQIVVLCVINLEGISKRHQDLAAMGVFY